MAQNTDILLAGLCQLALLPIAKPGSNIAINNSINELKYQQLISEQQIFKNILKTLILTDKNPLVIREIIFILGNKVILKFYFYFTIILIQTYFIK